MNFIEPSWQRAILAVNSNIEQAIYVLNEAALKIVLITDAKGILIGTVSDGDIRRGLLQGLNLTSPIESIIHRDAIVVSSNLSHDSVRHLMKSSKIQQIPIVDEKMQLLGLHLWDEMNPVPARSNLMVIMAGGKGTRLHPYTENCPKPMLLVGGKPMLEHILDRAKGEGFSHFVVAIYYLGDMIEQYFGNGSRFGVKIEYLRESSPLGTAGALSLISHPPDSAIIVTNGDVLTDIRYGDLLDFHNKEKAAATMAVRIYELQNPFGVVETKGNKIIGYEEKPISRSQINAGVYVIQPSVLGLLSKSEACDMPTLFERLKNQGENTVAYLIYESWLDVGNPTDLVQAGHHVNIEKAINYD
jgi:dTDP-glucose pyrophosphorylase